MNLNEMTEVDAMQLVTKICEDFKGNLVDHQMIQQALNIILNKAFPVPDAVPLEERQSVEKEPKTIKPDFKKKPGFKKNKTETEDSK